MLHDGAPSKLHVLALASGAAARKESEELV